MESANRYFANTIGISNTTPRGNTTLNMNTNYLSMSYVSTVPPVWFICIMNRIIMGNTRK